MNDKPTITDDRLREVVNKIYDSHECEYAGCSSCGQHGDIDAAIVILRALLKEACV